MERATGLQYYDVIADPKVGESDIKTKYSNCNIFQITTHLLKNYNIKVVITQLWKQLQVCNFTML